MLAQVLLVALLVTNADAQLVTTIAGGGQGHADGVGTNAQFTSLAGISVDPSTGTLFAADEFYLRSMNLASGLVMTVAGGGGQRYSPPIDGYGTNAIFSYLGGVAVNGDTVFVSDVYYCGAIRNVTPSAVVSTFAGREDYRCGGYSDGIGTNAVFVSSLSFAVDTLSANLYVADYGYNTVRSVSPSGLVSTIAGAGNGQGGWADGTGTNAVFNNPTGLTVDSLGTVYICDLFNHVIRAMKGGFVSTYAGKAQVAGFQDGVGSNARFNYPNGITVDVSNILYVADRLNFKIRRITPDGVVTTLVGGGANGFSPGYADGLGTNAYFSYPYFITIDKPGSTLYVTDIEYGLFPIIRSVDLVPPPSLTSSPSPTSSPSSFPSSTDATYIATLFGCAIGGGLVVLLAQEGLRRYRLGRVVPARKVEQQLSGLSGALIAPLLGVSDGDEVSLN